MEMGFSIAELNKLQTFQKNLERCQVYIIEQLGRCDDIDIQQLLELCQKSRITCDETASKLEIQDIVNKLKQIRKAVILESGANIPDLKLFQVELVNLISSIHDIRAHAQMKAQELNAEENRLFENLEIYKERMNCWSEPVKINFHNNVVVSAKVDLSNSVPKDVKKFMDFVKNSGGHENGWDVADHQIYIKLRKKCKDLDEITKNLNAILPALTIEEVRKHESWYVKYLNLKEKHIEAIKNWQRMKEDIKNTDSRIMKKNCVTPEESKINPIQYVANLERQTMDRQRIKEEIENWKKKRKMMDKIQNSLKNEESKLIELKDIQNKEINKMKSETVKKWKAEKMALEKDRRKNEEAKKNLEHNVRVTVANKMIKLYQMQDQMSSDKKKITGTGDETPISEKKMKTCQGARDPERLFRPTQQWIHRFLATKNEYASPNKIHFVTNIPKLQTPTWRRNL